MIWVIMMNKYQEALNRIKKFNYRLGAFNEYPFKKRYKKTIDTIQELVDKETPMKLVYDKSQNSKHSIVQGCNICPRCKSHYGLEVQTPFGSKLANYCGICGQKIITNMEI